MDRPRLRPARWKGAARRAGVAWAVWLLLGVWAPAGRTEQAPAAPFVRALLARFDDAAGMRAVFRQVNHWSVWDEPDTARGTLTVAPPDRFALDYEVPTGQRIGCDGRFVWTFIPEDRQVLRAPVAGTTGWGEAFLHGFAETADSMATIVPSPDGRRLAQLQLGARPEWGVQRVVMEIDTRTGDPAAYGYTDEEGNRYRFDFLRVSFPPVLPDSVFQFRAPPNYEILDVD